MGHVAWNKGLKGVQKMSPETRKKIGLASRGRVVSIETRKKLSKLLKGKKSNRKGYKHSLETKEKISIGNRGKKRTEEVKQKIGLGNKGKVQSLDTRLKISNSLKGEKSYLWKGGKTLILDAIRNLFQYRQWRSDVFTRDNWTCQICGKNKCYIEPHHVVALSKIVYENNIKTIEEAIDCMEIWNTNNGVTLCIDCHKLTDNYKGKSKNKNVGVLKK